MSARYSATSAHSTSAKSISSTSSATTLFPKLWPWSNATSFLHNHSSLSSHRFTTMLLPPLLAATLALAPALVSAGLFPKDSLVKMIDAKQFKKVMKENVRCVHTHFVVIPYSSSAILANKHRSVRSAMVWGMSLSMLDMFAPKSNRHLSTVKIWRRNTARLPWDSILWFRPTPLTATSRRTRSYVLIRVYRVSQLSRCVQRALALIPHTNCFVHQLYPRGGRKKALDYDEPNRSASALYYWGIRNIPHAVVKHYHFEDIPGWLETVRPALITMRTCC